MIREALRQVQFIDDGTRPRRAKASDQTPYRRLYRRLERKENVPAWLAEAVRLFYHDNHYPEYLSEHFIRQGWNPSKVNLPGLSEAERRLGVPVIQIQDDGSHVILNESEVMVKEEPGLSMWDSDDDGVYNTIENNSARRSGSSSTLTPPSAYGVAAKQTRVKTEPEDDIAQPCQPGWDSVLTDRTIKEEPTENEWGLNAYPRMFSLSRILSPVRQTPRLRQGSAERAEPPKAIKKESLPSSPPGGRFGSAVEQLPKRRWDFLQIPKVTSGIGFTSAAVQRETTAEYKSSRHRGNSAAYIAGPLKSYKTSTRIKREDSFVPCAPLHRERVLSRRRSSSRPYAAAVRSNTTGSRKIKEEEKEEQGKTTWTF